MFVRSLGDGAELRILEPRHAAEFLAFVEANRDHLSERLGWGRTIRTEDDARAWLQRSVDCFAACGLPWIGIWQDGAMAGGVLFFPLEESSRSTAVGYWLSAEHVGRGLVTRALEVALAHAFEEVGVNRVGLEAEPDNARSRSVAERLGFVYEGTRRQVWSLNGSLIDQASYSLLADDWRQRR